MSRTATRRPFPKDRSAGRRARAAVVGAILVLASCALPDASLPPATEWPARPRVEAVELHHTVVFDTDSDRLSARERARLEAFLDGLPPRLVGRVRIAGHADERASEPYNLDLAARRARTVADIVGARLGVDPGIDLRSFGESRPVDRGHGRDAWARNRRAEVTVRVAVVEVEGCEPLAPSAGWRGDNGPHPGFGCATARNLAATIADPADLARPRPLAPAGSVSAAAAVERYRRREVAPLLDTEENRQ